MILRSIICKADMTEKVRKIIADSKPSPNVQNPVALRSVYYRREGMRRKDSLREDGTPSISSIVNCETGTGFLIDATMNWNGKTYALSVDGKAGPTYDDFLEVNRNVARFLDSHTYRFLGVKNGSVYRVVVDLGG